MSQKLNVLNELNASYFCITRQDMKNFHFVKGDAEGLVNEPLRIKDTAKLTQPIPAAWNGMY